MKRIEEIRARLTEIRARLQEITGGGAISAEALTEMTALNTEFATLKTELQTLETAQANLEEINAGPGRKTSPASTTGTPAIQVGASAKDRFGGFNSSGDFLMAVKRVATHNEVHENFKNAMYEKSGEDGGYLVPEDISQTIIKKIESDGSLLAMTRQFTVSGNTLSLPIDESQPWNSGVTANWLGEGKQFQDSKTKIGRADLKLQKLGALCILSEELLEDAVAIESYVKSQVGDAIRYSLNKAIIAGDGTGKPAGFLNSPFTYTVAAESGQQPDTIVTRNVFSMWAHMFPQARGGAVWLAHPSTEMQLLTLKDDNGNFIYLPPGGMNSQPYGLLMGRPVIFMLEALPALGDTGDLCLVNMDYYFTIQKAGIKQASSIHMKFDREEVAFRFSLRIDGKVPFKTTVKTENGNYEMSAFVKLAAR